MKHFKACIRSRSTALHMASKILLASGSLLQIRSNTFDARLFFSFLLCKLIDSQQLFEFGIKQTRRL